MTLRRAASIALRGVLLLAALALAAGLGVRIYGMYRFSEVAKQFERDAGSLIPAQYAPPDVPMLENAATWFRRGIDAMVVFRDPDHPISSHEVDLLATCEDEGPSALDAQARALVEEVLNRNRPALALIERGATRPRSRWSFSYREGSHTEIPNLRAAVDAARALACDARLALERDQLDAAIARFEQIAALARSHEHEPILWMQMIGAAIERMQLFLGRDLLSRGDLELNHLDRLERGICVIDVEEQTRRAFALEAATLNEVLRGELPPIDANHKTYTPHWSERVELYFDGHLQRAALLEERGALVAAMRRPWIEGAAEARAALGSRGVAVPNLLDIAGRSQASRTLREGFRTALALRREGLLAGRYPASIPENLQGNAIDRLTARPLAYAVRPDGSARLERVDDPEETKEILSSTRFDGFYWELPAPEVRR
ncbi:MAG TPA: hypothetical protein VF139_17875 [Candidatus Polarisedimenticolaceae bacterium]